MIRQSVTVGTQEYRVFVDGTPPKVQRIQVVNKQSYGCQHRSIKVDGATGQKVVDAWRQCRSATTDPLSVVWSRSA